MLLALLLVGAHASVICRSEAGRTQLLARACTADPFCADQYPGLAWLPQRTSAAANAAAEAVGVVQNRPIQGLLADSRTLGLIAAAPDDNDAAVTPLNLQHFDGQTVERAQVHAVVWGTHAPLGLEGVEGLLQVNASHPDALDCTQLTPPYDQAPALDLTLRVATNALVRYRQSIVAGPLCTDPMRVRVYSPHSQSFACVCRENHDCEQPKYEVPLVSFLFLFNTILAVLAAGFLGLSSRDLLRKHKTK